MTVTLNQLADALNVSRRSLERAMKSGSLRPTVVEGVARRKGSGQYLFTTEQVEDMKWRASEARSRGSKYVMGCITSTGTPAPTKDTALSASAWARQTQWKRKNVMRRSSPEVTLASALAELLG